MDTSLADRCPGHIHRGVAAADHDHVLPKVQRILPVLDGCQEVERIHGLTFLQHRSGSLPGACREDKVREAVLFQLLKVCDFPAGDNPGSETLAELDIILNLAVLDPEMRDRVFHNSAGFRPLFEHDRLDAGSREEEG